MQHIHQHRKSEQQNEADCVDDRLCLAIDRLAPHPFDGGKYHFRTVQRGNGQQVKHGEIDADIGRNLQKLL